MVKDPTRITETTLKDAIIISEKSTIVKAGSIDPGMSDHMLVYAVINLKCKRRKRQSREVMNYRNTNLSALHDMLEETPMVV